MGKLISLNAITTMDLSPEQVLESARGKLEGVVLIGFDKEGEEYFASSYADGGMVLWLLEKCKKKLLEVVVYEDEDDDEP